MAASGLHGRLVLGELEKERGALVSGIAGDDGWNAAQTLLDAGNVLLLQQI